MHVLLYNIFLPIQQSTESDETFKLYTKYDIVGRCYGMNQNKEDSIDL